MQAEHRNESAKWRGLFPVYLRRKVLIFIVTTLLCRHDGWPGLQAACYSPLPFPIRKQPTSDGVVVAIPCNNDDVTRRKQQPLLSATNQRWRVTEAYGLLGT